MIRFETLVAALAVSFVLAIPSCAAVDAYLTFEGLSGEMRGNAPDAISVESMQWGDAAAPRDAATGMASGRRQHKPLVIWRKIDRASPMLMQACATGKHFPRAVLRVRGETFTLEDVIIVADNRAPDGRTESLSIAYERMSTMGGMMHGGDMQMQAMPPMQH